MEYILVRVSDFGKKIKIFTVFASLLLITLVTGFANGVNSKTTHIQSVSTSDNIRASTAHAIVKSSCSVTPHPDLCHSTLSSIGDMTGKVKTSKDVVKLVVQKTKERIQRNYFVTKTLTVRTNLKLTKRGKIALHDCLEMATDTLDDLNQVTSFLETYPPKKRIHRHIDDIITRMSTTITNQETCIDGFSHDKADGRFLESVIDNAINARMMCGNALALIKNMTDTDMGHMATNVGNFANEDDAKWPEWLSEGDRRLLQSETVTPNVTVAADGSGNFTKISDAVAAAENGSSTRFVIGIAEGVYHENVEVPKSKWNLMFLGSGQSSTTITGNLSGKLTNTTTFNSATVGAMGAGFLARDITFENTAGPEGQQAVALRVGANFSAFYRCSMIAYQDTLYVHSNFQFYVNCYISGTVDFICGSATAVLQDCDINARRPILGQMNMVTAQSRSYEDQNTGIVIQKSRIGAADDLIPVKASVQSFLGRPWSNLSRVVVMQSEISDVIDPLGWSPWNGYVPDTLYYGEYNNTGDGADTSRRVTWPGYHVITNEAEAEGFTPGKFIDGGDWLQGTGFPFSLGF